MTGEKTMCGWCIIPGKKKFLLTFDSLYRFSTRCPGKIGDENLTKGKAVKSARTGNGFMAG